MPELVDRHGSAKHPERPVAKKRPDSLDDATVEALGKLLGGHRLDAVLLELLEAPRVHGQPAHGHLGDLGNLEMRARRHAMLPLPPPFAARPLPCGRGRATGAERESLRYDFTKSRMTAMTNTNSVRDSMKARPRIIAVWMRFVLPG